jgi:hypothetical protein
MIRYKTAFLPTSMSPSSFVKKGLSAFLFSPMPIHLPRSVRCNSILQAGLSSTSGQDIVIQ